MRKKQKKGILIIVLGFIIILFGFYFNNNLNFLQNNIGEKQKQVSCDVVIRNPFGLPLIKNGDLRIESSNCVSRSSIMCGLNFGIFSDSGELFLEAGGKQTSVSVNVKEPLLPGYSKNSYNLKLCVPQSITSGEIKLISSENQIIDSKGVNF